MNIIFLADTEINGIEGAFITEVTTKEEIEEIISNVKAEIEGEYTFEDISERLPADVTYCKGASNNIVWY